MPRYAVQVAYDGTAFTGWWAQAGLRTVQGEIAAALERMGEPGRMAQGASRTDRGVHARGQLAHVDLGRSWKPSALVQGLGRHLPDDVVCLAAAAVSPTWHASRQARSKTYRYAIDVGTNPDPFIAARFSWRLPYRLDLDKLQEAARGLDGIRAWDAFRRRGESRPAMNSNPSSAAWSRIDRYLVFEITGDRFPYRLVRSLVGGMVHAARNDDADWRSALAGTRTGSARQQAPARGLCLAAVIHDEPPDFPGPGTMNPMLPW